jgi:hypothetical protein
VLSKCFCRQRWTCTLFAKLKEQHSTCCAKEFKKVVKLGVFFKVSPPYVFANNNGIFDSKRGHFDVESGEISFLSCLSFSIIIYIGNRRGSSFATSVLKNPVPLEKPTPNFTTSFATLAKFHHLFNPSAATDRNRLSASDGGKMP